MVEELTEGDGELFVVNVDHISELKAGLNLKTPISNPNAYKFSKTKIIHPNSPHKFKSLS